VDSQPGYSIKVSICMVAYNHERFIAQAIESVMMQIADFDYELVIGEDKSTDTTREICLAYQAQYPDKIRVLTPEVNLGMMRNFAQTYAACTGEYVALLDGDDYWTSPTKLQTQVTALDANSDYTMCFTRAACFNNETNEVLYYLPLKPREDVTIYDFLQYNPFATCTVMLRKTSFQRVPDWFDNLKIGDWVIYIVTAQHGPAIYIPEITAWYRLHGGSVHSHLDQGIQFERMLAVYQALKENLDVKYRTAIQEARFKAYMGMAYKYFQQRTYWDAVRSAGNGIRTLPVHAWFSGIPVRVVISALRFLRKNQHPSDNMI
jgi:glycosyltransferase involved in cell wall biosynthesis